MRWQAPLALVALLVGFFVLQASSLAIFERDYDEGVYLAEAHLLRAGHRLYAEVPSASPPFFLWGLVGTFALAGGPSVAAARIAIWLSGALGLLALAASARRLAPPAQRAPALLVAPLLLLLLPRWLFYGQLAMADIPSLSGTLGAVALALQGWQRPRHARLLFAAGAMVAGIAVGVKMLAAYSAPLLALVVLLSYSEVRPFSPRRFLGDGLATLAGFLLPALLAAPFLDLPATIETIFRFPWEAGRQWSDPLAALRLMGIFHWEHLGWLALALAGLADLARRRAWRPLAFLLGWELLVVVMLSQHAPLWGHLLLPLAPPVVLAGALAVAAGVAERPRTPRAALPVALLLLLFAGLWPRALQADRATIVAPTEQALLRTEVVPWLQQHVPPDARILTDDPMIAVRAGRLVPYDMSDTSFTKIHSGFLTTPQLIAAVERDQPAAIIFWSDRFRSLPDWQQWVEAHYPVGWELSPTRRIFLRPDLAP